MFTIHQIGKLFPSDHSKSVEASTQEKHDGQNDLNDEEDGPRSVVLDALQLVLVLEEDPNDVQSEWEDECKQIEEEDFPSSVR